jgi:hypothetical protein
MTNALNVATLTWSADTTETFETSESFALPGWAETDVAGARWHMQARDVASDRAFVLDFDTVGSPPTIVVNSVATGAGVDANGNAILGVTATLTFTQSADAVAQIAAGSYVCALKIICADGTKSIVANGTITLTQGPTRE